MATVSGAALANSVFPVIRHGAGASSRGPAVRDFTGLAAASANGISVSASARASQPASISIAAPNVAQGSRPASGAAADAIDTGIDGGNGVRLAGDNGALLDLSTSLGAQEAAGESGTESENPSGLTDAEEEQVSELRQADRAVRRHEAAHAAVGGAFAGSPTFTFERGPDGQLYAVAGEVSIDTAPVDGDPEATIQKLQIVRSAALAPGDPSAQDRAVAAQAEAGIRRAQAEIASQRSEELAGEGEGGEAANNIGPTDPEGAGAPGSSITGNPFGSRDNDDGRAGRRVSQAAGLLDIAI